MSHPFQFLDLYRYFMSFIGTPYWSQGAKKQFYVSKRCATKKECERIKHSNMDDCTYIWYQDWKCSDCCQGDKCNYYVIVSHRSTIDLKRSRSNVLINIYMVFVSFFSVCGKERTRLLANYNCCINIFA